MECHFLKFSCKNTFFKSQEEMLKEVEVLRRKCGKSHVPLTWNSSVRHTRTVVRHLTPLELELEFLPLHSSSWMLHAGRRRRKFLLFSSKCKPELGIFKIHDLLIEFYCGKCCWNFALFIAQAQTGAPFYPHLYILCVHTGKQIDCSAMTFKTFVVVHYIS